MSGKISPMLNEPGMFLRMTRPDACGHQHPGGQLATELTELSAFPTRDGSQGWFSGEGWAVGGACRVLAFDVGEHADDAKDCPLGAEDRRDLVVRLHTAASRYEAAADGSAREVG